MVNTHPPPLVREKRVSNIKVHFKIAHSERGKLRAESLANQGKVKPFGNFFTFRPQSRSFVFVVFPLAGHVNVSGIRHTGHLHKVKRCFAECNDISVTSIGPIIIDNITASGRFTSQLNLPRLFTECDSKVFKASLRPHLFPSALLRPRAPPPLLPSDRLGSVILFANGKFVIVGSRSLFSLSITLAHLCHLSAALV